MVSPQGPRLPQPAHRHARRQSASIPGRLGRQGRRVLRHLRKGGNVAQTAITSDWFQGDEEKVTESSSSSKQPETKRNHYFGPLQRDDTVGQTGIQVSIPLFDSEQFIGVAVVLVIIDKL